jgi:hypothetical protein
MVSFDFITDEALRASLVSDHRELEQCLTTESWKAAHVLAGSIVEAVLVDSLIVAGQKTPDPTTLGLADLIVTAKKAGLLTQKTADLSSAVKNFRNLIHPGRAKRLGETVDGDSARVGNALVGMIVRDVATQRAQQEGLTAQQIVSKFESDHSALGIARHLLKDAKPAQIEQLLLDTLPARYFELAGSEYPDWDSMQRLVGLFRSAFESAQPATKKKVAGRMVDLLREASGDVVTAYEENLFRASDLAFIDEPDQTMVKEHLLARMGEGLTLELLTAASGLEPFLKEDDVNAFVDPLLRPAVAGNTELGRQARTRLEEASFYTGTRVDERILARLDRWAETFDERGFPDQAEATRAIKAAFDLNVVPF